MKKRNGALAMLLALCLFWSAASAEPPEADSGDWLQIMTEFVTETGIRESFTPNQRRAAAYLTSLWEAQGYRQADGTLLLQSAPSPREVALSPSQKDELTNVIAVKKARNADPAIIILCAHYDSSYETVGAKDNASGMAAVLTLSEAFAKTEAYPDTELRFIAFDGEEYGELGSTVYVNSLTIGEGARVLAVFNIDILAVEEGAADVALSCNTLGGRRVGAYLMGYEDSPVSNQASLAFEKAFRALGGFEDLEWGIDFCIPRHWGAGDNVTFHNAYIDAATICFQGNMAAEGAWPEDMHTPEDDLNKRFDLERTQYALDVLCRAVDGLAADHEYSIRPEAADTESVN